MTGTGPRSRSRCAATCGCSATSSASHPRLRRAGAAGRRGAAPARGDRGAPARGRRRAAAGDEIVKLVASWSLEQAEQVARAFAVYFHLANLAEEHQRIRTCANATPAPSRCGSRWPPPWPRSPRRRPEHLRELLASLRVHLVLTAHPTEARRRAVVAALRRISGLLDVLDDQRTGRRTGTRRGASCASRSTCCGGPPSCGSRRWTPSTRSAR